ncbi:hypothetical protein E4J66_10350 [Actinomyces viscosus]|uniref:Uncharacterized protein n=2 Tax=Actinomyces viscosus TaxID=1656 RepID=A0A448PIF8_ACTVI|nr:hypothetical protein E4J66_10350 [Actinomyces viscosus]VEI14751.1 Uncharacterised protein [Actinomyces viscosus]
MALRFNPPPNWPAPPEGFEPPAGWQPDPAWGPAPEGWQIWVDDSAPSSGSASSAAGAAAGSDPAWAPTQAVSTAPTAQMGTNAPVADPTGMSASAPSGDYAGQATGTSPYAANMDYAQSPTPFQGQGAPGGPQPPAGGWQPGGVGGPGAPGGGSKSITQQWWFWTGAAVLVVILVISAVVWAMSGSSDDNGGGSSKADQSSSQSSKGGSTKEKSDDSSSSGASAGASSKSSKGNDAPGSDPKNPIDPTTTSIEFKAGKYNDDPDASVTINIGTVEWNANEDIKAANKYLYQDPPAGKVYIRVPVEVTYKGKGQYEKYGLQIDYSHDGNTSGSETFVDESMFNQQDMPRDGGSAKGYFVFLVDEATANDGKGVFAVTGFSGNEEVYVAAK